MKIDDEIERQVREAYAAAVGRQADRSASAMQALAARGDEAFRQGVTLALAVDVYVLVALHEGVPGDNQVQQLAASFTAMEAWAEIDQASAEAFLNALAERRDPATVLPPAQAVQATFVIGGWLLSAFLPEGKIWEDFLDEALAALEGDG
jgi:hypothetical protein